MTDTPKNAFTDLLPELGQGDALLELHGKLVELVGQVRAMGKPGELSLKLKIEPPARAGSPSISIVHEIVVKPPKSGKETTNLFVDEKNQLTRRDPRQPALPSMEKQTAELRSFPAAVGGVINRETGEVTEP